MTSTFFGLETAKRALATQQSALYTTGHNIANANTPGYTRQRVNFATTTPYPSPGMNQPQIPGQIGTGVKAGDIQRIRDSFTDMQYRTENSNLGYWQAKANMLSQMEDVMNEPSNTGLSSSMDEFWNGLQDLSVQPQNDGARRVVRERGISLVNTFNYMSNSLKAIQKDYRKEIDVTQDRSNSILRQINQINKQIGSIEPHGYLPNDLYDERDRLIDELSTMMNIKVERKPSGGLASANAEGLLDVYLATPQGDTLLDSQGNQVKLIDSTNHEAIGIHIQYDERSELDSPIESIKFFKLSDTQTGFDGLTNIEADSTDYPANPGEPSKLIYKFDDFSAFISNGKLRGLIEGYGYNSSDGVKGTYNDMLDDLDLMAYEFATEFNSVHNSGWSLNEIRKGEKDDENNFFSLTTDSYKGAAANLKVDEKIKADVQNIAAASADENDPTKAFIGNGSNALALADVKDAVLSFGGNLTNVQSFYQGMIGKLGDNASEANRMLSTSVTLKDSVEQRRMSESSVSLDEEMMNMIKFQHAYNAAARNITLVDEMLDKIINGMGVAGR